MVRRDGSPPEKQENYPVPNTTGSLIANLLPPKEGDEIMVEGAQITLCLLMAPFYMLIGTTDDS